MTNDNTKKTTSVDEAEIAKFTALADAWWDPKGEFRPLHKFNPTRIGYIRDFLCDHFGRTASAELPLSRLRILDIGCGGGLLCEPLARLGAAMTGADAGLENIDIARLHAAQGELVIDYRHVTAEALKEAGEAFDVVLNMEVVEHVAEPSAFLKTTAGLVAPGGVMIAATINRTAKSYALAIVGAEYVLGWVPRGTHDWNKFLKPEELEQPMIEAGLEITDRTGVTFNPVTDRWSLSSDMAVNYMIGAVRPVSD